MSHPRGSLDLGRAQPRQQPAGRAGVSLAAQTCKGGSERASARARKTRSAVRTARRRRRPSDDSSASSWEAIDEPNAARCLRPDARCSHSARAARRRSLSLAWLRLACSFLAAQKGQASARNRHNSPPLLANSGRAPLQKIGPSQTTPHVVVIVVRRHRRRVNSLRPRRRRRSFPPPLGPVRILAHWRRCAQQAARNDEPGDYYYCPRVERAHRSKPAAGCLASQSSPKRPPR